MTGTITRYVRTREDGTDIVKEIHKVVVHRFNISDVEDPDLYAAEPILKWEQSEEGQFVMKHSVTVPVFNRQIKYDTYGYEYAITAELEKNKLSEFYLRWRNK